MSERGRPSAYDPTKYDYPEDIMYVLGRLVDYGLTPQEIDNFVALRPSADDFYVALLCMIRRDSSGVIALRKRKRRAYKARYMSATSKRIENSVRARMWQALKGESGGRLWERLDYSKADLMGHLKNLFCPGMTFDNYGKWHIDHIKPCALFDHGDPDQFRECWSLENLQPLWASDNAKKGAKYVSP